MQPTTINLNPTDTGLSHLSFSAVRDFLKNPRMFRKRWIDLDFDRTPQLALIEGSAFHAALEIYWGFIYAGVHLNKKVGVQIDFEEMKRAALFKAEMEYPKSAERIKTRIAKADVPSYEATGCEIECETTESRTGRKSTTYYAVLTPESIAKTVCDLVAAYMNERDETTYTPIAIEYGFIGQTIDFETKAEHYFPLKARVDLIVQLKDGSYAIVDHKYVGKDLELDEEEKPIVTPAMILQAAAYESIGKDMLKSLNIEGEITTVIFDVMNKKTGTLTQVPVVITDRHRAMWSRIYRGVQLRIMLAYAVEDVDSSFLPNIDDWTLDGWVEFEKDIDYSMENDGAARPTEKSADDHEYEAVDI